MCLNPRVSTTAPMWKGCEQTSIRHSGGCIILRFICIILKSEPQAGSLNSNGSRTDLEKLIDANMKLLHDLNRKQRRRIQNFLDFVFPLQRVSLQDQQGWIYLYQVKFCCSSTSDLSHLFHSEPFTQLNIHYFLQV